MDRTVQPTKPVSTKPTPAFTSAVASSSKEFGQTSNVVNQAAHTELSIEFNRGDQNLSQPSVRAHWASQTSHTDDAEVGLTDEDFDTDPGDPFSIVEGRGSRKRFRKSQFKQDVGDTTYETEWPALRSTVHPGIRPTIQSAVRPSSYKNVNSNRPSTTNTT